MTTSRSFKRNVCTLVTVLVCAMLLGCGGGSSTPPTRPPEQPTPLQIVVNAPSGTVGTAYLVTVSLSGGTGAISLQIASGSLPPGLAVTQASTYWQISGTPTQAGTFQAKLKASDSGTPQQVVSQDITILVIEPFAITSERIPDAVMGAPYNFKVAVSGGTPPYAWSPGEAPWFPSWATIDSSTGELSGTPSNWGNSALKVYVHDSSVPVKTVSKLFNYMIAQPLRIQGTVVNGTLGVPYSTVLYVTGGWGSVTTEIAAGEIPPGLVVSKPGVNVLISGTPTKAGTYNATLRLSDTSTPPQVLTQDITISIDTALSILSTDMAPGIRGRAYSGTPNFVNGAPPFHWSASYMPSGLSLDSQTGEISGTPAIAGYFFPRLTVSDSSSPVQTATKDISLLIYDNLSVSCGECSLTGRLGEQFNGMAYATGGVPPLTWTLQYGTLPAGMRLETNGYLTGTPTQTGTFQIGLRVQDGTTPPQVLNQLYTLTILPPLPFIQTSTLANGIVGTPYAARLIASMGTSPYFFTVSSGALPPGLSLASGGNITGTPNVSGNFDFTAKVIDSASPPQSTSRDFRISVRPKALGRNNDPSHATPVGNGDTYASISPYSEPINVPNPDTDFFKILALGGSTLTVEAVGYPIYSFTANGFDPVLEIVDANGVRLKSCRNPEDDNPDGPIIADTTPTAFDDDCLNHVGSTDWIESHLDLQVPGSAGQSMAVYAHVLDFRGDARPDMTYILRVSGAVDPLRITTTTLKPASVGLAYSRTIATTGGTPALKFGLASGSSPMPAGLTLSESGIISGVPTAEGNAELTVEVSDAGSPPQVVHQQFSLAVAQPPVITNADIPPATTGLFYSYQFAASGGTPPIHWSFYSERWPCCVQFDNGLLSGTPSISGTYTGYVWVNDDSGNYDRKTITLVVSIGPLYISTTGLPDAKAGWSYTTSLQARGGDGKYQWSIVSGALPVGVSLNTTNGAISGTPEQSGTYVFTVQVADSSGQPPAQKSITLTVQP